MLKVDYIKVRNVSIVALNYIFLGQNSLKLKFPNKVPELKFGAQIMNWGPITNSLDGFTNFL